MHEDRNQDWAPKQQERQKHPDEWQRDLNPGHMAGQNIGGDEAGAESGMTAFHLRKRGSLPADLGRDRVSDSDLKRVPVLPEGTRLQQGGVRQSRRHRATGVHGHR